MNILMRQNLIVLMFASSIVAGTQAWANDGIQDETTGIKENCEQHAHSATSAAHTDKTEPCVTKNANQQPKTMSNMQHNHGDQHNMPMNMDQMDHSMMRMPVVTPPSK